MSYSLTIVLHRGKPQSIDGLFSVGLGKSQVPVDLLRIGGRIDREHLAGIILPHDLEQPSSNAPAVIGRIDEKPSDMLGCSHTECSNKFVAIKRAIKGQLANSLLIFQTCPEMVNALLRVLRRFKLQIGGISAQHGRLETVELLHDLLGGPQSAGKSKLAFFHGIIKSLERIVLFPR